MKIVTNAALSRGSAFIQYAYSHGGRRLQLEVPDLIGLVAAYIGRGGIPEYIEAELAERINPNVAADAKRTFDLFATGRHGLWSAGPAVDDIRFHHRKFDRAYPAINEANDRLLGG